MNHKKIYTERLELKVTKSQRKLLDKIAKEENKTLNEVIRNAIDLYV